MMFSKAIAACLAFGCVQTVLATTLAMTRCYCVSDDKMGWVNIYNLTTPGVRSVYTNSTSTVWYRNGTVPRDDFDYPYMCGKECNADRSDCWTVPYKTQYRSMMRKVWPDYKKACVTLDDGRRMCADQRALQINERVQYIHGGKGRNGKAAQSYENKLDCSAECRESWPEMKSACTHLNTNRKSKHYDQAVPCGHTWRGKKLLVDSWLNGEEEACAVDVRTW